MVKVLRARLSFFSRELELLLLVLEAFLDFFLAFFFSFLDCVRWLPAPPTGAECPPVFPANWRWCMAFPGRRLRCCIHVRTAARATRAWATGGIA